MDSKELRNLQEAYLEVYNELDEQLDDNKRKKAIRHIRDTKKILKTMGTEMDDKYDPERGGYEPEPDKKIKKKTQREQVDIYDIILSHLLDEGYAETLEAAESMMVHMSEEWRDDIVEKSGEQPLPYGRMMNKSNKLADSGNPEDQKRAATIYLAANAPKGPKVKVRK